MILLSVTPAERKTLIDHLKASLKRGLGCRKSGGSHSAVESLPEAVHIGQHCRGRSRANSWNQGRIRRGSQDN
jgi:hypothetical protein